VKNEIRFCMDVDSHFLSFVKAIDKRERDKRQKKRKTGDPLAISK
jgi:hypothetical protein